MEKSITLPRVTTIPLRHVSDEQWRQLRRLAYIAAAFGNRLLSEQYALVKGTRGFVTQNGDGAFVLAQEQTIRAVVERIWKQVTKKEGKEFEAALEKALEKTLSKVGSYTTYTDEQALSALVRDAVCREVSAVWVRNGRKILRGEQTLGRFSAHRALVVRDRGIRLVGWGGGNLVVHLRCEPKPAEFVTLRLDMHGLRHWKKQYQMALVHKLWSGEYHVTKAAVLFERPGRKIALQLSYDKPVEAATADHTKQAVIIVLSDGTCRVQSNGQVLTLTDRIYRMVSMKEYYARIHARLRASLGKAGRRQENRRALLKSGSFEGWCKVPLHQFSHAVVDWCQARGVGFIAWQIDEGAPELPWFQLHKQVEYKAGEVGILTQTSQSPPDSEQNDPLRKNGEQEVKKEKEKQGGRERLHEPKRKG